MRSLIREVRNGSESSLVTERVDNKFGGKDIYFEGIMLQAGVKNHNQRIYPTNEIARAIDSFNERIRKMDSSILGELNHPQSLEINPKDACIAIEKLWMNGNNGFGRAKVLSKLPMGQIVAGLIEEGIKLGVSTRGTGEVLPSGEVRDFELVTIDVVTQPSAPDAFPKPVFESLYSTQGFILSDVAYGRFHGDKTADKHFGTALVEFINKLKV